MTKYVVVSHKVGTPGDEFVPPEGVNVAALLAGGFISTKKSPKPDKTNQDETEQ